MSWRQSPRSGKQIVFLPLARSPVKEQSWDAKNLFLAAILRTVWTCVTNQQVSVAKRFKTSIYMTSLVVAIKRTEKVNIIDVSCWSNLYVFNVGLRCLQIIM